MAGMLFSFSSQVEIALNQLYTDPWAVRLASWVEALHVRDSSKNQIGVQKYKTENHCGE